MQAIDGIAGTEREQGTGARAAMNSGARLLGLLVLACGLFASSASAQSPHPQASALTGRSCHASAPIEGAAVLAVLIVLFAVVVFRALKKSNKTNNPDGDIPEEG
ncbi:MAG: hypothetical protein IT462_00855 [Planctomycetes bacterium]|nr:hypothetical protein [Planctomycetota bacterium]